MTPAFALIGEGGRLYVAIVLAWAALAKGADLAGFRDSLAQLVPLPARWVRPAAIAVVATEAAIAAALVAGGDWARMGTAAALFLFAVFTAVIATALVQGRRVSCSCFGGAGGPVSGAELVRNGLMMAAGATSLAAPPLARAVGPGEFALLLAGSLTLLAVTINLGALWSWLSGEAAGEPAPRTAPIGEPVPAFEGRTLAVGEPVSAQGLRGQAVVLVFLSARCPTCRGTLPEIAALAPAARRAGVALWIVPLEGPEEMAPLLQPFGLLAHGLVLTREARRPLNPANAAPFYLFIGQDGVLQASHMLGDADWRSFVEQMREIAEAA